MTGIMTRSVYKRLKSLRASESSHGSQDSHLPLTRRGSCSGDSMASGISSSGDFDSQSVTEMTLLPFMTGRPTVNSRGDSDSYSSDSLSLSGGSVEIGSKRGVSWSQRKFWRKKSKKCKFEKC